MNAVHHAAATYVSRNQLVVSNEDPSDGLRSNLIRKTRAILPADDDVSATQSHSLNYRGRRKDVSNRKSTVLKFIACELGLVAIGCSSGITGL